jgi:hypothetical protein
MFAGTELTRLNGYAKIKKSEPHFHNSQLTAHGTQFDEDEISRLLVSLSYSCKGS